MAGHGWSSWDWGQGDNRHWTPSQTYRESIRAPLLATIKRVQREMDHLTERVVGSDKERQQAEMKRELLVEQKKDQLEATDAFPQSGGCCSL